MRPDGIAALAALALVLAPFAEAADWLIFESDFDDERKEWKEIVAKLPPYPRQESLIAFDAGSATPHKFFIDAPSISVGEDGVVRYSLVVKTAGGATNVSFEGIRCAMRHHKVYAIGHADGKWVRARDPRWRRILYQDVNRHHGALYSDILCRGGDTVKDAGEALNLLKYGKPEPKVD
jgi:hypothetical protein